MRRLFIFADASIAIFLLMNSQWAAAFTLEQVSEQLLKILFDVSVLAAMFSRAVRVKVNCSTSVFVNFPSPFISSALTSFSSASSSSANILF